MPFSGAFKLLLILQVSDQELTQRVIPGRLSQVIGHSSIVVMTTLWIPGAESHGWTV